jgi:GNAT superfamily N-acetyltransferase
MKLRPYHPDDLPVLVRLFHDTIHKVALGSYSQTQVEAWAPAEPDLDRWRQKLHGEEVLVADLGDEIVGFCSWDSSGYLDFLYVHHAHQRQGVAAALYAVAEAELKRKGQSRIHTQASLTAQPFFLKHGFRLVKHQTVQVRGVNLPNAVMEKLLA